METKDNTNVTTYRSHRVGSVTAGLSMVGIGNIIVTQILPKCKKNERKLPFHKTKEFSTSNLCING